jgi:wyosine [tRNA(Phe)-imidazoG37] synthetase (radical SAM superfamily)
VKRLIAMKHEALNQLVNNISQHICSFECNYCNLFVGFIDLSNKIVLLIVLID